MKSEIITSVSRSVSKAKKWGKKNSPELLIAAGVFGVVTGVVMACKATVDTIPVVNEATDRLHELKENTASEVTFNADGEAEESIAPVDVKKETVKIYGSTALKVVKNYAPAVIILTFSVASIIGSHNILKKRNGAIAAAYVTLDKTFTDYRGRVADKYGEEVENDIYQGFTSKTITEEVTDEEGNVTKEKIKVKVADANLQTPYSFYFVPDECAYADPIDSNWNYGHLLGVQNALTQQLRTFNDVTLSDLYIRLGKKVKPEDHVIGKVFDSDPDAENVVDLGITMCYLRQEDGTLKKTWAINPRGFGLIM